MTDIVKRLEVSIRFDAINGDANERNVCKRQMVEAMAEINRLRRELEESAAITKGYEMLLMQHVGKCGPCRDALKRAMTDVQKAALAAREGE